MPLRLARRAALLALITLLFACRSRETDEPADEPTATTTTTTTPTDAAPLEPAVEPLGEPQPPVRLELAGTLDVDGHVHTLAVDRAGNVLAATRQGRAAAWMIPPTVDDFGAALPSRELETWASSATALADGLFALVIPDLGRVELVRTPAVELTQDITVRGAPADAALAHGRLWLAVRQTPDGKGLLAIDPANGALELELVTGDTPVALAVAPALDPLPARLLAVSLLPDQQGELLAVPPDAAVGRVTFPGLPLHLVPPTAHDPRAWIMRHDEATLLPIETAPDATLRAGTALPLPFVPRNVLRAGADAAFFIAHGDGRIARVPLTDPDTPVEARLAKGATELAVWGDHLLALEPAPPALVVLDARTLEEQARLALADRPGRMALDAERSRVIVSLPQRQQLAVVTLHRAAP